MSKKALKILPKGLESNCFEVIFIANLIRLPSLISLDNFTIFCYIVRIHNYVSLIARVLAKKSFGGKMFKLFIAIVFYVLLAYLVRADIASWIKKKRPLIIFRLGIVQSVIHTETLEHGPITRIIIASLSCAPEKVTTAAWIEGHRKIPRGDFIELELKIPVDPQTTITTYGTHYRKGVALDFPLCEERSPA